MTEIALGECHPFEAAGRRFLYLVPSAAVFALDETSAAVVDALSAGRLAPPDLFARLAGRFSPPDVEATLAELAGARVILPVEAGPPAPEPKPAPNIIPLKPIPLSTLVVNVTNRCNLACTYCYEYGEDRIAEPTAGGMPKLMSEETARASVDFMVERSGSSPVVRLTFFGGETLLNFAVLEKTIPYARRRAAEAGKRVEFSLTTNGTLLRPEVIEFLADNDVGVTISIDGPKEMQDRFRVFHDGRGSYDVVAPKVRELLRRHRSRPIGARVTLTSDVLDITRIYRHLTDDIGFWEVGFAPVTTSPGRSHAIGETGFDAMLAQFRELGQRVSAGRPRRSPPRLQQRARHDRGTPQGRKQGAAVRGRARADGRRHQWRRGALSPVRRLRRPQAGDGAGGASTRPRRRRSSTPITSTGRPTAGPAGRVLSARAAVTMRRTRATGRPRRRICTIASGYAAGRKPAWRSTARSRSGTRRFSGGSTAATCPTR